MSWQIKLSEYKGRFSKGRFSKGSEWVVDVNEYPAATIINTLNLKVKNLI